MAESNKADPVQQFEQTIEVIGRAQQMILEFMASQGSKLPQMTVDPAAGAAPAAAFGQAMADWSRVWSQADMGQLARLSSDWWTDSFKLWNSALTGDKSSLPEAATRDDKRFSSPGWSETPVFDIVRQSYLLASHYIGKSTEAFGNLDEREKSRLAFQAKQFVDSMSPTNFAALNPDVIELARQTNGQSLIAGLQHLLDDIRRGKLTMTDERAFEVGRNVAATPGKVVFENEMFQLIHYQPTTEQVHEIPLLIFPPWINKFYILDLTPKKSFVRWAVEQGLSVYIVSWRQASADMGHVVLDHFVKDGFLTAIDKVREASGAPSVNAIGYCVAGTTLAITLSYLAAKGESAKVKTATYFTAQVDFTEAGDMLHFINEPTLQSLEAMGATQGYVDGRYLATSFNMLRPTDLLWNYVVNNYLMGKDYVPFDLLYWNSDATHVPARWHLEYLKDCYRDNKLMQPGGIIVDGVPIDLKTIQTPSYVQAGREDHIAPMNSCFRTAGAFSGPCRFIVAGSGHIAGVVNPPEAGKYQYWSLPEGRDRPDTVDSFLRQATETPGSWWPDWIEWLKPQSGPLVPARIPGEAPGFAAIEDAPGRYVKERIV